MAIYLIKTQSTKIVFTDLYKIESQIKNISLLELNKTRGKAKTKRNQKKCIEVVRNLKKITEINSLKIERIKLTC